MPHSDSAPPDLRRFFGYTAQGDTPYLVVAADHAAALQLLADHGEDAVIPSRVREINRAVAATLKVRPDDDSPAQVLFDAPMGSVYCSEV